MSKIPLPERGQPLDLSYIYEVAKAVNSLAEDVSPSTYKYVSVDSPMSGMQKLQMLELLVVINRL